MKETWTAVTAVLVVVTCGSTGNETEMPKNRLSGVQTVVKLLAEDTKRLEDIYSDVYFELNSLTVVNFKTKVAVGDTFYAYIGRPSCGDCNAFEPMFECYTEKYRLGSKIYFAGVYHLHRDRKVRMAFRQQYKLSGTPVLVRYSRGRQVNKLDLEDNDGGINAVDLEKWLALNKL